MKSPNFETMPIDELWELYTQLGSLLARKLTVRTRVLEQQLSTLRGDVTNAKPQRRQHPKARPKISE